MWQHLGKKLWIRCVNVYLTKRKRRKKKLEDSSPVGRDAVSVGEKYPTDRYVFIQFLDWFHPEDDLYCHPLKRRKLQFEQTSVIVILRRCRHNPELLSVLVSAARRFWNHFIIEYGAAICRPKRCAASYVRERSWPWLTLILLTWTIWRAPTNASKWRMGFNSAFKGLRQYVLCGDKQALLTDCPCTDTASHTRRVGIFH